MDNLILKALLSMLVPGCLAACSGPKPDTVLTGKLEFAMIPGGHGESQLTSGNGTYVLRITKDTELKNIPVNPESGAPLYRMGSTHLVSGIAYRPDANDMPRYHGNPITIGGAPDGYVDVLSIEDVDKAE
jgi:hypothetical protein